ncbi:MAG TPA: carbon monoxide dehydrogenase subunit G, partial [Stellaceae bacterium]|nr:carbon monoxide dehydrogenase subunit G [Stellaceae bacterium]
MDMTGEFLIPAPRRTVWDALNDPEILKQSIPGCEEIEKLSDTELQAKVTAKVGPVKARFGGKLAQIGSRLIDATARKMAEEFFSRFSGIVGGNQAPAP